MGSSCRRSKKKGGRTGVRPPKDTRKRRRLERETQAEANLSRRLELRGRTAKELRHRLAEIRIRLFEPQLGPRVIVEGLLLVEQVEHIGQERDLPDAAHLQDVRRLRINLTEKRRARLEPVDGLDT